MFNWTIINYHYILHGNFWKGLHGYHIDEFRYHINQLKKKYCIITIGDMLSHIYDRHGDYCTICFDDGLKCVYDYAFPVMLEEKIGCNIFICSSVYEGRILNVQKIHFLTKEMGFHNFKREFLKQLGKHNYTLRDVSDLNHNYQYDTAEVAEFKSLLNFALPFDVRDQVLNEMFQSKFGQESELINQMYLSNKHICDMLEHNIEIGSHFHSHNMLSLLNFQEKILEVKKGIEIVKKYNKKGNILFSYPYGSIGSYDQDIICLLETYKCLAAFTMGREKIHDINFFYGIPRFSASDVF